MNVEGMNLAYKTTDLVNPATLTKSSRRFSKFVDGFSKSSDRFTKSSSGFSKSSDRFTESSKGFSKSIDKIIV